MPEGKKKSKRKALSQKTRFEVFKRDQFTCQYCGRKAPDVVLQVDHIVPVANGGKNDILNLVTSCVDCNSGKSDRKLDDASVVEKQRREMELRQERLEQIRMMGEWQRSLVSEREAELEEVNKLFTTLHAGPMEKWELQKISPIITRFGFINVLEAIRIGMETYDDATETIEKLGGICYNNSSPELKLRSQILQKMKRYFTDMNWKDAAMLIDRGRRVQGMRFLQDVNEWLGQNCSDSDPDGWEFFYPSLLKIVQICEQDEAER